MAGVFFPESQHDAHPSQHEEEQRAVPPKQFLLPAVVHVVADGEGGDGSGGEEEKPQAIVHLLSFFRHLVDALLLVYGFL